METKQWRRAGRSAAPLGPTTARAESGQALLETCLWCAVLAVTVFLGSLLLRAEYLSYRGIFHE
jgi:hypothetical protein